MEKRQSRKWPFVISVPHCSHKVPDHLLCKMRLGKEEIMESVDVGTEEIFGNLPVQAVVKAEWSRLVVDVNRAPSDTSDKGVVALRDYHGREIYKKGVVIDDEEISSRVANYHVPYHEQLRKAIASQTIIGLFDCHSLEAYGPPSAPDAGQKRSDIVLGNNGVPGNQLGHGRSTTCPNPLLSHVIQALQSQGFSVSINYPYSGGYITTCYGVEMKKKGGFALQIEINQALYTRREKGGLDPCLLAEVRSRIWEVFKKIASIQEWL